MIGMFVLWMTAAFMGAMVAAVMFHYTVYYLLKEKKVIILVGKETEHHE